MQRNLVPVTLRDQRPEVSNDLYLYFIDPLRALPADERAKYSENEHFKSLHTLDNNQLLRKDANTATITHELKIIGLALQRMATRLNKSFSSGAVRVRYCDKNTATNTYNLVLEHHGIVQVYIGVPIPQYEASGANIDFSKITIRHELQASLVVEDLDVSVILDGSKKGIFTSADEGGYVLNLELPELPAPQNKDNKFADDVQQLTPPQRTEALKLFPEQNAIFTKLDELGTYLSATNNSIKSNQALLDEITTTIDTQKNIPDEVKTLWQTIKDTTTALKTETSAHNASQQEALAQLDFNASLPTQNLKQTAEYSLVYNYGIHKGHERFLVKPTENGIAKALRLTALQYFNSVVTGFKVDKTGIFQEGTNKKISEFNLKFAGVAVIKTIRNRPEEGVLCFESSLAKKNLEELATLTNNIVVACTYYQGRLGYSEALAFLTKNLEETPDTKQKYTLTTMTYSESKAIFLAQQANRPVALTKPLPFQWLPTISEVNQQSPYYDAGVLNTGIARFTEKIKSERNKVNTATTNIQASQNTLSAAIQETTITQAKLAKLKSESLKLLNNAKKIRSKQEAELASLGLAKTQMIDTAKKRQAAELTTLATELETADLGEKIEKRFSKLDTHLAAEQNELDEISRLDTLIQNTNSITIAEQLRTQQDGTVNKFIAARKKATTIIDLLNKIKPTLDQIEADALKQEAEQLETQRKAQDAAARSAAAEREQARLAKLAEEKEANDAQTAAAQIEINKQLENDRKLLVIETAKKLGHIVSAVSYWHQQVRLWGGVNVPNPDGGGVSSVPRGVSEMLKFKNTLNMATLTYDQAVKFMTELKSIANIADQRGSWKCCYPVRKTGTTGALYSYIADFNIEAPMQAGPSETAFNNIYPGWKTNYGVANKEPPLLTDAPVVPSPRLGVVS